MNIALVVILIVAGVILLLLELFLLPGFGIAGITGFLSLAGAVAAAYLRIGATEDILHWQQLSWQQHWRCMGF